jgi:hypothetical protein
MDEKVIREALEGPPEDSRRPPGGTPEKTHGAALWIAPVRFPCDFTPAVSAPSIPRKPTQLSATVFVYFIAQN